MAMGFSPTTLTGLGAGAEQVDGWAFVRKERERQSKAAMMMCCWTSACERWSDDRWVTAEDSGREVGPVGWV